MTPTPGPAAAALVDGERLWRHLQPFATTVHSSGSPAEAEAIAAETGQALRTALKPNRAGAPCG